MYISETASVLLGLPQIDLTGSSIFDYVHPADHNDLLNMLGLDETDRHEIQARIRGGNEADAPIQADHLELGRSFSLRMKCILPKRNAGLIKNGYKSIHCTGYLKVRRLREPQLHKLAADHNHHRQLDLAKSYYQTSGSAESVVTRDAARMPPVLPAAKSCHPTTGDFEWDSYALVAVGQSLLPTASTEIKLSRNSFMFRANLDLRIFYMEAT